MGIHYVNFVPISNRCARERATLCPLAKCYQERHLTYIFGECKFCKHHIVGYSLVRHSSGNFAIRTIVVS
ncbi:Uncharacterised protein [Plesiomonas shigelloides]|nr:Uncharacterised protein [Plesiomonas shigelloides]